MSDGGRCGFTAAIMIRCTFEYFTCMVSSSPTSASKAASGGCATEVKAVCISRCAERGGAVDAAPVVSVAALSDMLSVLTFERAGGN